MQNCNVARSSLLIYSTSDNIEMILAQLPGWIREFKLSTQSYLECDLVGASELIGHHKTEEKVHRLAPLVVMIVWPTQPLQDFHWDQVHSINEDLKLELY